MNVEVRLRATGLRIPVRVSLSVASVSGGLAVTVVRARALGVDPFGLVRRAAVSQLALRIGLLASVRGDGVFVPFGLDGVELGGDLTVVV